MAQEYLHDDVLDNGLDEIKQNANALHLIYGYIHGDSRAIVISKSVATKALTPTDMVIGAGAADQRVMTLSAPQDLGNATGNSGATPDLSWAFIDGTRVLAVADAPDQEIFSGNPVTMNTDTTVDSSYTR